MAVQITGKIAQAEDEDIDQLDAEGDESYE